MPKRKWTVANPAPPPGPVVSGTRLSSPSPWAHGEWHETKIFVEDCEGWWLPGRSLDHLFS